MILRRYISIYLVLYSAFCFPKEATTLNEMEVSISKGHEEKYNALVQRDYTKMFVVGLSAYEPVIKVSHLCINGEPKISFLSVSIPLSKSNDFEEKAKLTAEALTKGNKDFILAQKKTLIFENDGNIAAMEHWQKKAYYIFKEEFKKQRHIYEKDYLVKLKSSGVKLEYEFEIFVPRGGNRLPFTPKTLEEFNSSCD